MYRKKQVGRLQRNIGTMSIHTYICLKSPFLLVQVLCHGNFKAPTPEYKKLSLVASRSFTMYLSLFFLTVFILSGSWSSTLKWRVRSKYFACLTFSFLPRIFGHNLWQDFLVGRNTLKNCQRQPYMKIWRFSRDLYLLCHDFDEVFERTF